MWISHTLEMLIEFTYVYLSTVRKKSHLAGKGKWRKSGSFLPRDWQWRVLTPSCAVGMLRCITMPFFPGHVRSDCIGSWMNPYKLVDCLGKVTMWTSQTEEYTNNIGNKCVSAQSLRCVWLFASPWTVACQASLSLRFSRQEYWVGCHFLL